MLPTNSDINFTVSTHVEAIILIMRSGSGEKVEFNHNIFIAMSLGVVISC